MSGPAAVASGSAQLMSATTQSIAIRASRALLLAAVVIGFGLRVWQYGANTSLRLDEIALAQGILDRDLWTLLLAPLPYNQVAPKAFLLIQKLAVMVLGPSDHILRLFPFVSSLVALVAFASVSQRVLDAVGSAVATTLFATAAPLIAFAGSAKQYSTDVAVAVLLWWIAVHLTSRPVTAHRAAWAGIAGALLVWFSQPGVLMLVALGGSLVLWLRAAPEREPRWRRTGPILLLWGVSATAVTAAGFASMNPATQEYMHRFWAAGFPPTSFAQVLDTRWPWDPIKMLIGVNPRGEAALSYPAPPGYAIAAVVGVAVLWHASRRAAVLVASPLVITLGAAVARQYPFSDRLILFLVPGFLIAIGAAIGFVYRTCSRGSRAAGALAACSLVLPAMYPVAAKPPAYRDEDVEAVLSRVQPLRRLGDVIYVYYGAAPAVTFYGARYGIARAEYRIGGCHRGDGRRYLEELDTFRGRSRVWVLITHALPRYHEREDMLAYLDAIGSRRDEIVAPSQVVGRSPFPAEAYLYDLDGTNRSMDVRAWLFPVTGPSSADPRLGCKEGPQVMIPSDFR